jgi:hypothetical protein
MAFERMCDVGFIWMLGFILYSKHLTVSAFIFLKVKIFVRGYVFVCRFLYEEWFLSNGGEKNYTKLAKY